VFSDLTTTDVADGNRVHLPDEGGSATADAAEVTKRDESTLCFTGVAPDRSNLIGVLLGLGVTGGVEACGVGGGVSVAGVAGGVSVLGVESGVGGETVVGVAGGEYVLTLVRVGVVGVDVGKDGSLGVRGGESGLGAVRLGARL
jgi:hypothetical protein